MNSNNFNQEQVIEQIKQEAKYITTNEHGEELYVMGERVLYKINKKGEAVGTIL